MSNKKSSTPTAKVMVVQSPQQIAAAAKKAERKRLKRIAKRKVAKQFARPVDELSRSISALSLPYNEQVELQSVVDSDPDAESRRYVANLVAPAYDMARIPDSFADSTALVHSVKIVHVPCYFTGAGNTAGAFAAVINPGIGALARPDEFKVALVKPTFSGGNYSWPANLSDVNSFANTIQGNDLRIDTHYQILTQPQLSCVEYDSNNVGVTGSLPFGTAVTTGSGYGLQLQYATTRPDTGATVSFFAFPPGFYMVTATQAASGTVAGTNPWTATGIGGATVISFNSATSADSTAKTATFYLNVPAQVAGNYAPGVALAAPTPGTGPVTRLFVSTTFDDITGGGGVSADNGLIQKLRPTGCSVLASYTGPVLTNGGNIAAAFVPGAAVQSQFFNSSTTQPMGNLSLWQNLSAVSGAYNGPIKDGAYSWWSPTSIGDYNMYTPDEMAAYQYPSLIVAGQWQPGGDTTGLDGTAVIRLEIHTNYEICTDTLLLEKRHQVGSQAMMDRCLNHLVGKPHAMANAAHTSFMQKVINGFKDAGQWVWNNRKTIGTVATALGALV